MNKRTKCMLAMMSGKSKLCKVSGLPPLTYTAENMRRLNNYRIYGNTVSGESVGDKTANMFDGNWLQGYWKFNTGEWNDSSQYIATSIIDCTPNTDYTFSLTGKPINYGFIWYNQAGRRIASNYDHVEEGGSPTHYTATSPASAAFMAVNISREADKTTIVPQDVTDFMLVEGSVSSPYEPYGYRVPVIVEGKNLFDYDTIMHGYRIQWRTGENYADETAIMSDFISVSENSTYATDTKLYWLCYDANKQYIGAWDGSDIVKSGVDAINSMTAISPCPLATNIAAIGYIGKDIENRRRVFLNGILYTIGRVMAYTVLGVVLILIIHRGASMFGIQKFLATWGEILLGPTLIIIGLLMLFSHQLYLPQFGFSDSNAEGLKRHGGWGACLLGVLFAMAFCPTSGMFYFGMLIPMSATATMGYLLPAVFAVATALPVLVVAWLLAFSMQEVGRFYGWMRVVERWTTTIVGLLFILIGLYECYNIYL